MSNFFGNLNNPRMPDVVMNQGPLPPLSTDNLPYGLNGTPDARINYNNALLGDITPYVYGDSARITTQTSYLNQSYRIQKIVPELYLPPIGDGHGLVKVSHAVDYGDIAWSLRLRNISTTLGVFMKSAEGVRDNGTHITAFVNFPTVNYILVGFQNLWFRRQVAPALPVTASDKAWLRLWFDLFDLTGNPEDFTQFVRDIDDVRNILLKLMKIITPFGVSVQSEKQGGMHEVGLSPVMWAVNHMTSINIDGMTRDMINYWRHIDINSGDRICFRVMPIDLSGDQRATLNHFYKHIVNLEFSVMPGRYEILVPDTYPYCIPGDKLLRAPDADIRREYNRIKMHWYIGTTQQHYPKMYENFGDMNRFMDDTVFLKGALLQTTITPMLLNSRMQVRAGPGAFSFVGSRLSVDPRKRALGVTWADERGGGKRRFALSGPPPPKISLPQQTPQPEPTPSRNGLDIDALLREGGLQGSTESTVLEEPRNVVPQAVATGSALKPKKQVAKPVGGKEKKDGVAVSVV
jgi:hypothetical protein